RAAGFAAGLLAGAIGALAYALACTEMAMSFVAAWYTLGILMVGALGALLGPRVLRW
ncbi:MAG: NrsF family protein, partial [Rubrivivax sp.]